MRPHPSSDIAEVKPVDLTIDPAIQRTLDRSRVARMVKEFRPEGLGVITVSHRDDGSDVVIDGQHRTEAVRLVEYPGTMTARVFRGLSRPEEALLFRLLNQTAKPTAIAQFKVRVIEGDPSACTVNEIVTRHGWVVSNGNVDGYVSAVTALEKLHLDSVAAGITPDAADVALGIVTAAWGRIVPAANGMILAGIGLVYMRDGALLETTGFVNRLARYEGGPARLVGQARSLAYLHGTRTVQGMAQALITLYNGNRRNGKLEPWR